MGQPVDLNEIAPSFVGHILDEAARRGKLQACKTGDDSNRSDCLFLTSVNKPSITDDTYLYK